MMQTDWRKEMQAMPVYEMPVYALRHPRYPYSFYIAAPCRRAALAWAQQDDPMWNEAVPIKVEQTELMSSHVRPHFVPSNL